MFAAQRIAIAVAVAFALASLLALESAWVARSPVDAVEATPDPTAAPTRAPTAAPACARRTREVRVVAYSRDKQSDFEPAQRTANETLPLNVYVHNPDARRVVLPPALRDALPMAVLGVFCTQRHARWRDMHRAYLSLFAATRGPRPEVVVRFVVGGGERAAEALLEEQMQYGDLLILSCEENLVHGKSFDFFRAVVRQVPAQFALKADLDTFVHADNLARTLRELLCRDGPPVFYGCLVAGVFPLETGRGFLEGAIYGLGLALAKEVSVTVEADGERDNAEDQLMSSHVKSSAFRANMSVAWIDDRAIYDHPMTGSRGSQAGPFRDDTVALHGMKKRERWTACLAHYFKDNMDELRPLIERLNSFS